MALVSSVRSWKCPKCGEVLQKGLLEKGVVRPGQELSIAGTGTCSGCGTGYSQAAIYGGEYDFVGDQPTGEAPKDRVPTVVSVVLCREGATPPPDVDGYLRQVLRKHYGSSELMVRAGQMIGRSDRFTAADVGAIYSDLVERGDIPNYGHPTDQIEGEGPDGNHVAALVFWEESAPKPARKKWQFWR